MTTVEGRYNHLYEDREHFLKRAREAAKYTLPGLLPRRGHNKSQKLPDPYQSMGARGVNNLSSKLLMALFPPNSPFFRLQISDFELAQLTQQEGQRAEVEEGLNKVERAVQSHIEQEAIRTTAFEAIKNLVITGNVLFYLDPDGGARIWQLDAYVVKRDAKGNVQEIVAHDSVATTELDEETLAEVGPDLGRDEKEVSVYTHITRKQKQWYVVQEIKGRKIMGTEAQYPLDKCPYLALRWTKIDGESYGRGFVDEYIGDLKSLEGLTKATVEGAAAAAKVLFLVRSGSQTRIKTITEAPNLAARAGDANDVTVLTMDKHHDFQFALSMIERLEQRLSHAYLLTTSVQRQAERVTAEEIRLMAGELEDALGGVYSVLAQELQLPMINVLLHQLQRRRKIPQLPKDSVQPKVVAGLEALGRGNDLQRLQSLFRSVQEAFGPEAAAEYFNVGDAITRAGTALGVDMDGLVRSDEEVQQRREQQAQAEAMARQEPGQQGEPPQQ